MGLMQTLGINLPANYEEVLQKKRAVEEVSLDDLMTIAQEYGRVEIGSWHDQNDVELKCNFTGRDYVKINENRYPDMKRNLMEVINRAEILRNLYRGK